MPSAGHARPQNSDQSSQARAARSPDSSSHESGKDDYATKDAEKDLRALKLQEFRPRPMLVVNKSNIRKAKFPVVNVHTHLNRRLRNSKQGLDDYLGLMDRCGIALTVNLDCKLGDAFDETADFAWNDYKDRVIQFVNIDWIGGGSRDSPSSWDCQRFDFPRTVVMQLEAAVERGASGLKLFKQFGLAYQNADGTLLKIDDPRWDPIWQACGRLGIPVIMHTADPVAFFQPIDRTNERYEELSRHPEWSFYGDEFPSHAELIAARNAVIAKHPNTKFIGAHVANYPEDLSEVSEWLRKYPNLYVEIASRIGELGRKPYSAREFFLEFSDRIMFGTDGPKPEPRMHLYFRFLESKDEYFPYSEKPFPPQGLWNIYGIGLPEDTLKKVYFENAMRIIPGVKEKLEPVLQAEAGKE